MTTRTDYRFSILQYRQDPAAGETLNIGVLFFCPARLILNLRIDPHVKRLSQAFAGFDAEGYRRSVASMEKSVQEFAAQISSSEDQLPLSKMVSTIDEITPKILTDTGMAYAFGPEMFGVTHCPNEEADILFRRFVSSRFTSGEPRKRREDEDVWKSFHKSLVERNLSNLLQERTVELDGDMDYKFHRALGTQVALEPVSFDYSDRRHIRERVTGLLGLGQLLASKRNEIEQIFFLVGPPVDPQMLSSYEAILTTLGKFAAAHRIFTENEVEALAEEIEKISKGEQPNPSM